MRKVVINHTLAAVAPKIIPASQLDRRSEPRVRVSYHRDCTFYCKRIWENAVKGKYKVVLTVADPAKWVKQIFRLTDPEQVRSTVLPGINKTKVLKYAKMIKEGNVNIPPVIFAKNEKNRYVYFIDGNHRLVAAFLAGLKTVPCYRLEFDQLLNSVYKDPSGKYVPVVKSDEEEVTYVIS